MKTGRCGNGHFYHSPAAENIMAEGSAAPPAYRSAPPPRRIPVILIVELALLSVLAVLPLVLEDYLTIFVTRVLILALLALSFDLVWGYARIMSFGQALFFGSAGYGVCSRASDKFQA